MNELKENLIPDYECLCREETYKSTDLEPDVGLLHDARTVHSIFMDRKHDSIYR